MAWTLADLIPSFGGKPSPQMLGSGGAAQAGQNLADRAYQLYAQEMRAMGQNPIPYEQWKMQQGS